MSRTGQDNFLVRITRKLALSFMFPYPQKFRKYHVSSSVNVELSRISFSGLIVPIVTKSFQGGYTAVNAYNLQKNSKTFFSLTVRRIDTRSDLCNSPGEGLHVGVKSAALRCPVHKISDETNRHTHVHRHTHKQNTVIWEIFGLKIFVCKNFVL